MYAKPILVEHHKIRSGRTGYTIDCYRIRYCCSTTVGVYKATCVFARSIGGGMRKPPNVADSVSEVWIQVAGDIVIWLDRVQKSPTD
jgi:hypothetical protein